MMYVDNIHYNNICSRLRNVIKYNIILYIRGDRVIAKSRLSLSIDLFQ